MVLGEMQVERLNGRHPAHETRLAMFWAALVAQCAGEAQVTASRIAAALLRTDTARARLDSVRVLSAADDPQAISFEECEQRVRRELAASGTEFASKEHQATVQLRPLEPHVRTVLGQLIDRDGAILVPPLPLLLELLLAHPALAARLASHGLSVESIRGAMESS